MTYYKKYIKYKNKYLTLQASSSGNKDCSVWYTDSANFQYPELIHEQFINKEDIGIALPSGGLRSCVYSLGILRGLHHLGILQKTKYITSISGSSWLTSIFCFQNICSNDIFLGNYIEPENLTKEILLKIQNSNEFASVLHNTSSVVELLAELLKYKLNKVYNKIKKNNKTMSDPWSQTIGDLFYTKYELNDFTSVPCMNTSSNFNTVTLRNDVPFPIILGYIRNLTNKSDTFIEFTPLYYGMPIKHKNINGSGVYIEPVGMLSITQNILDNKQTTFNITPGNTLNNVISIMKSAGISSNAIPAGLIQMGLSLDYVYFIGFNIIKFLNQQLRMIDGYASYESNGITSLIKRRVQNIIFVCAIDSSDDVSLTNEKMISTNSSLLEYFNQNSLNYIFDNAQYPLLLEQMIELGNNKKPVVVQMKIRIVSNTKYGIVQNDDYIPTITFIHPSKNEWLDKIHPSSKTYINSDKQNNRIDSITSFSGLTNANFRNFPFTSILHERYSIELVNAMSQNAAYDVISSADPNLRNINFGVN
jgi:hypothetical protein